MAWCGNCGRSQSARHGIFLRVTSFLFLFPYPLRTRFDGFFLRSRSFSLSQPQQTFNRHYSFRYPSYHSGAHIVQTSSITLGLCQSSRRCAFGTQDRCCLKQVPVWHPVFQVLSYFFYSSFSTHALKNQQMLPTCPLGHGFAVFIAHLAVISPFVTYCCPSRLLRLDFTG